MKNIIAGVVLGLTAEILVYFGTGDMKLATAAGVVTGMLVTWTAQRSYNE